MEETDGIIIENLRKLGCDIEDDITTLANFSTEIVIEGVVKCLTSIQPGLQLNSKMPPNLPARYKLCMEIAKACKDIGYKGDLGYETFLHGSQAEIRNVFTILIQKLPKVNEQPISDSVIDPLQNTLKQVRNEILSQLHQTWLPYFCNFSPEKYTIPFHSSDLSNNKGKNGSVLHQLSSIPSQQVMPSLIEKHLSELATDKYKYKFPLKQNSKKSGQDELPLASTHSSRFSLIRLLQFSNADSKRKKPLPPPKPAHLGSIIKSEEAQSTIEEQCQKLNAVLEDLERELTSRNTKLFDITEEIAQMKRHIELKETEQDRQQKDLDRQQKLYALLPDAPAHLARMKTLLESNNKKMDALQEQWLEIKVPLDQQYEEWLKCHENSAAEKLRICLEQTVVSLRQTVEEICTKDDAKQILQSHLESLQNKTTRNFYTERILSIVANVKKQNEEMHRVLEDVKSVQREINSMQGKVERTFAVTDEMIFRMAKSDETARRIYKYLISLHTDCSEIQNLVKESGNLSREIKDLEDQAETELRKNVASKLRRVQSDLEQIRVENRILEERIHT